MTRILACSLPVVALLLLHVEAAWADAACYEELQACRDALFLQDDLVAADNCFEANLGVTPPCDRVAAGFRAVTRVLRFFEDPVDPVGFNNSFQEILDRFGFAATGRSIYHLEPKLPKNLQGEIDLPSDSPTGTDMQETIETLAFVAAVDASVAQLEAIPSGTVFYITEAELAGIDIHRSTPLEIDHSDRLAAIGALRVYKAQILLSLAYDLEFDIDQFTPFAYTTSIQSDIIDAHPMLLTPRVGACGVLTGSKASFQAGIDDLQLAWQAMQAELDDQSDDFVTLDCLTPDGALSCVFQAEYQAHGSVLQSAMDGRVRILNLDTPSEPRWIGELNRTVGTTFPDSGPDKGATADLSILYGCNPVFSPRDGDSLPMVLFDPTKEPSNFIHRESFEDKTFGGILLPVPEPSLAALSFAAVGTVAALSRMRRRCGGARR